MIDGGVKHAYQYHDRFKNITSLNTSIKYYLSAKIFSVICLMTWCDIKKNIHKKLRVHKYIH